MRPPICDKTAPPHLENPGSATDTQIQWQITCIERSCGKAIDSAVELGDRHTVRYQVVYCHLSLNGFVNLDSFVRYEQWQKDTIS